MYKFRIFVGSFFIVSSIFVILNIAAVLSPTSALKNNIKTAFAKSHLIEKDDAGLDVWRGQHQYQDCLVLMQALNISGNWKENAFLGPKSGDAKCKWLYNFVFFQVPQEELLSSLELYWQYNHGTKVINFFLASIFNIDFLRAVYKFVSVALIFISGLLIILMGRGSFRENEFLMTGILFIFYFMTINGMDFFGQNLSHGLGDWVRFGFVCLLLAGIYLKKNQIYYLLLCVVFGCLAAYVEYLIGILPFCISGILFCGAVRYWSGATDGIIKWTSELIFYFMISFIGTFIVFLAIKSFLFSDSAFQIFWETFTYRINGESYQFLDMFYRLTDYVYYLGSGNYHTIIINVVLLAAFLMLALSRKYKFVFRYWMPNLLLLLASILPLVWYVVFMNHTYVHVWFMLRLLTFSFLTLAVFALFLIRSDAPAMRMKTAPDS